MLIVRRSKVYYTVSGIITPIGGRPVHRLREDSLNLCTGWPPAGVMIPEAGPPDEEHVLKTFRGV